MRNPELEEVEEALGLRVCHRGRAKCDGSKWDWAPAVCDGVPLRWYLSNLQNPTAGRWQTNSYALVTCFECLGKLGAL